MRTVQRYLAICISLVLVASDLSHSQTTSEVLRHFLRRTSIVHPGPKKYSGAPYSSLTVRLRIIWTLSIHHSFHRSTLSCFLIVTTKSWRAAREFRRPRHFLLFHSLLAPSINCHHLAMLPVLHECPRPIDRQRARCRCEEQLGSPGSWLGMTSPACKVTTSVCLICKTNGVESTWAT